MMAPPQRRRRLALALAVVALGGIALFQLGTVTSWLHAVVGGGSNGGGGGESSGSHDDVGVSDAARRTFQWSVQERPEAKVRPTLLPPAPAPARPPSTRA